MEEEETPQLKRRRDSTASTVRYPSVSESRERIPVPVPKVAAYARSRSRGARIPETPQLEPRIVLPIDEEQEIIPQFVRRGRSPAPLAAVVEEQETPQLPERIRRRMEAHRNQEAQGQAHEMLPGRFLQKFRAHLQSKQAAQKRAATAVPPLRRETISEMMEAIEASASGALSPRGRKPRITIDFEKRRRVGV